MAHEPKLEIYKLKLVTKKDGRAVTFRQLFRSKFNSYGNTGHIITIEEIFNRYYKDFLTKIDLKGYKKNDKKKKGFTISSDIVDGKKKSHISSPLAKDFIISGILDGGKYGIIRSVGDVDDTTQKTPIRTTNIVGDKFFFLLYTPLEHSEGVLMIQGYTEAKISDVVRDHLMEYFKHEQDILCKVEFFVPQYLKEKYLNNAIFKSLKFSSSMVVKPSFNNTVEQSGYEFEIKIEITDKSKKPSNYKKATELLGALGKSLFKPEGGKEKELSNFEKKSAKMSSEGKVRPIDFDDENNVRPVILLKEEGIRILEGEIPDFNQIEEYCRKTLNEVVKEVMPAHAVEEL